MQLDPFLPLILTETPGCPDPMARQALVLAAIDFCRETLCWTEISDPIPLVDNEQDYELDPPNQGYVHTVRDVWLNNRRLQPKPMAGIQEALPNWMTQQANEPVYYNQAVDRGSIRVYPIPLNATMPLVVRAAYVPILGATSLPDFLGQRHADVLAAGAKARLMLMPGLQWTNEKIGAFYKTIFDDGIVKTRVDEIHDRVPGTARVNHRSFGF